ncbi:MAG: tRNA lysidine(34) synthetase TilS [Tannerella sp.]|nr:tRNA lysidine(34) synthetase TilS [Tannerella sp.]
MIRKVQTYIDTNRLLTFDKPVITGFSGGGDSVVLLHVLNRLGYKCVAAHCNFHLRGAESNRDETFCRIFAEKSGIPFEKTDFETASYAAQEQISIEMAARKLRYDWFETMRKRYDAQAVAVAHHSDDSIETMLINMMRGTGIRGLRGIQPRNGFVVRPLLCTNREEINHYLEENGLDCVTDSTNLSDEYTRNFVRLRLLPLMKNVNPSVGNALARTAENLAGAECIYSQAVKQAKALLTRTDENGCIHLSIDGLMQQPAPQTILYELLEAYGFSRCVSGEVYKALTGEPGKIFEAPDSEYKLLKDRNELVIFKPGAKAIREYTICDETTGWDHLPVALSAKKVAVDHAFKIDKSPLVATLDYDKVTFPLRLRKWQSGDWFIPFGMKGRQKLSDYFSNHKLNLWEKEQAWILCSSNQDIVWIVGKRTDNRFRIDNKTKTAFIINFSPKNCNNQKEYISLQRLYPHE